VGALLTGMGDDEARGL